MLASFLFFLKYIGGACLVGWILAQAIFYFTEDDE